MISFHIIEALLSINLHANLLFYLFILLRFNDLICLLELVFIRKETLYFFNILFYILKIDLF